MTSARKGVGIPPLDEASARAARRRQDTLTKPPGSLGELERIACRMTAIQADPLPRLAGKWIAVVAADHGVAAEAVSAYPQAVTSQMVSNFLRGGAAINVLARAAGIRLLIVDAGLVTPLPPEAEGLERLSLGPGTANMSRGPAMTAGEAKEALERGLRLAEDLAAQDAHIVGIGEMGIGNTTSAAAMTSAFTGLPAAAVTGHGTGVAGEAYLHKLQVVERALELHRPDPSDPLGVLAMIGGFEIGVMAGLVLGAAGHRIAVALDGFISTAAALLAQAINGRVTDYAFACHLSAEPGHAPALERLGLRPLLDLDMRLGEGTGAALGIQIIEAAVRLHNEMATFEQASVSGARC